MYTNSETTNNKGLAALTTYPSNNTHKTMFTDNSTNNQLSTPIHCDRYSNCSANICPLDQDWQKSQHLNCERVCFYLIEAQKTNAKALFEGTGRGYLFTLMLEATHAIIARHYPIKYSLERAKKTNSRMDRKIGVSHE